jgi:hypothetical protein
VASHSSRDSAEIWLGIARAAGPIAVPLVQIPISSRDQRQNAEILETILSAERALIVRSFAIHLLALFGLAVFVVVQMGIGSDSVRHTIFALYAMTLAFAAVAVVNSAIRTRAQNKLIALWGGEVIDEEKS